MAPIPNPPENSAGENRHVYGSAYAPQPALGVPGTRGPARPVSDGRPSAASPIFWRACLFEPLKDGVSSRLRLEFAPAANPSPCPGAKDKKGQAVGADQIDGASRITDATIQTVPKLFEANFIDRFVRGAQSEYLWELRVTSETKLGVVRFPVTVGIADAETGASRRTALMVEIEPGENDRFSFADFTGLLEKFGAWLVGLPAAIGALLLGYYRIRRWIRNRPHRHAQEPNRPPGRSVSPPPANENVGRPGQANARDN